MSAAVGFTCTSRDQVQDGQSAGKSLTTAAQSMTHVCQDLSAADMALCWRSGQPDGTATADGIALTGLVGNCSGGSYALTATYQGSTANPVLVYSTVMTV